MPSTIFAIRQVVLPVLIFLAVFRNLPDWFILFVNASEFFLVCSGEDLLVQNLCLLVFALKLQNVVRKSRLNKDILSINSARNRKKEIFIFTQQSCISENKAKMFIDNAGLICKDEILGNTRGGKKCIKTKTPVYHTIRFFCSKLSV